VGEQDGPFVANPLVEIYKANGRLGLEVRGERPQAEAADGCQVAMVSSRAEQPTYAVHLPCKGCNCAGRTYGAALGSSDILTSVIKGALCLVCRWHEDEVDVTASFARGEVEIQYGT
jgi:hypothetical protein